MNFMTEHKHAWYSAKMAELRGTYLYQSKSDPSVTIEAAIVNASPTEHGTGWDDMVYLGEVGKFINAGRKGSIPVKYGYIFSDSSHYE